MDKKHALLRNVFRYPSFRPGQEPLIDALLQGRDALGVLPTGAGKSLCYQLPALVLPGITLVVSPLIALMHDQVDKLRRLGIPACFLDSSLDAEQQRLTLEAVAAGTCKLVYVAPERLVQPAFWSLAATLPIALLVVDEAHCISHWGHDFRPPYREISRFLAHLERRPTVAAFTATATPQVQRDILTSLDLHRPQQVTMSFDRSNLYFEVRRPADRKQELLHILRKRPDQSGIVYCLTRRQTDEIYSLLREEDIPCVRYHAGLPADIRQDSQRQFLSGESPVIVATNAFGMGIDKPDVAFVIHFGMPADLESYYQEAGRAGRSGQPARCLLLFDETDIQLHEFFLTREPDNPALTEEDIRLMRRGQFARLREMRSYALSETCLRQRLLTYFGESAPDFCKQCSCCHAVSTVQDMTTQAQMILSCIHRAGQQAGLDDLCRILHGDREFSVVFHHWDTLSTFGLMKDTAPSDIRRMVEHLMREDCIGTDEQGHLRLKESARAVLFHGKKVSHRVRLPKTNRRANKGANQTDLPELYLRLYDERKRLATLMGIPAHFVCTDRFLIKLTRQIPKDVPEMQQLCGRDEKLFRRCGKNLLIVILGYMTEHPECVEEKPEDSP